MIRPLVLVVCLAWAAIAGPLAVVVRTEGSVTLTTAKGEKSPKAGDLVLSSWKIATGRDGRVRLRLLADKTLVDLKPSSAMELEVLERADRTLRRALLLSGDAACTLSADAGDFRAETRTAIASGSLAQFDISTGLEGGTKIQVADGTVSICDPSTGDHVVAGAGTTTTSSWDGLAQPVASSPVGAVASQGDSTFSVEVRLVDPASGSSSRLLYGLGSER